MTEVVCGGNVVTMTMTVVVVVVVVVFQETLVSSCEDGIDKLLTTESQLKSETGLTKIIGANTQIEGETDAP